MNCSHTGDESAVAVKRLPGQLDCASKLSRQTRMAPIRLGTRRPRGRAAVCGRRHMSTGRLMRQASRSPLRYQLSVRHRMPVRARLSFEEPESDYCCAMRAVSIPATPLDYGF